MAIVLVSTGLAVTTGNAAHAEYWASNFHTCAAPYLTGAGHSMAHGGGPGWPNIVRHYRVNETGGDQLVGLWTNISMSWTPRFSTHHGSGKQAFGVLADFIDSVNSGYSCDFVG